MIRWLAVEALRRTGPAAEPAIPALIYALHEREGAACCSAANTLKKIGRPAIPFLIRALSDEDMIARQLAAQALGGMEPSAREALPALREAFKSEQHPVVQQRLIEAIEKITTKR
jgi:HEAT repeat protein